MNKFLKQEDNRRGLALSIVITSLLLALLDSKIPFCGEVFLNSKLDKQGCLLFILLFFPSIFILGKNFKNELQPPEPQN